MMITMTLNYGPKYKNIYVYIYVYLYKNIYMSRTTLNSFLLGPSLEVHSANSYREVGRSVAASLRS
jgi:hypothetical protein